MTLTSVTTRMVKLGSAAAALLIAGGASAEMRPPSAELGKAGWTLVTASDDTYVYMRSAGEITGDVRRVWTAYDATAPLQRDGFTFRSVRSLGEFDCRRRMTRIIDEFYHDGSALQGHSWRSPMFQVTPWATPAAESVGAIRMAFACRALNAI